MKLQAPKGFIAVEVITENEKVEDATEGLIAVKFIESVIDGRSAGKAFKSILIGKDNPIFVMEDLQTIAILINKAR